MFQKFAAVLALCLAVQGSLGGYCPDRDLIEPCVCRSDSYIYCSGDEDIDLVAIFERLSQFLTPLVSNSYYSKNFALFHLNNSAITELPENTFKDITFNEISIQKCSSLTTINRNAFAGTDQITTKIEFYKNPELTSPDNSIFDALSRFTFLRALTFNQNNITEIPSYAFSPPGGFQSSLTTIELSGKAIKKIGSGAFIGYPYVRWIHINETSIDYIPSNAFQLLSYYNYPTQITFVDNLHLNSSAFGVRSLANLNRPTKLILAFKDLIYLPQDVFEPFLKDYSSNTIDLNYARFDCNDCRNYWLIQTRLLSRLSTTKCSNGNNFEDPDNFKFCGDLKKKILKETKPKKDKLKKVKPNKNI